MQFFDPDHAEEENRFILLGMSFKLRVIIVCHCFRESETIVRVFSARKADKDEEQEYWSKDDERPLRFSKMKGRKNPMSNT